MEDAVVLVRFCKYLAVTPFIDKKGKFSVNKKHSLTVSVFVCAVVAIHLYFYNKYISISCSTLGVAVMAELIILRNVLDVSCYEKIFEEICFVDNSLSKYHKVKVPKLRGLILTALTIGWVMTLYTFHSPFFSEGKPIALVIVCSFTIPYYLFTMMLVLCLARRFRYTALAISSLKLQANNDEVIPRILNLVQIYNKASNAVLQFNNYFGVYLFYQILCYCGLSLKLEWEILTNSNMSLGFYITAFQTVITMVSEIAMCIICNNLESEGNNCMVSAYQIMDWYVGDEDVYNKVSHLAQQTSSRRPVVTALGFFNINHAFLFTLFNLMVTYTIVLLQFSIDSNKVELQV